MSLTAEITESPLTQSTPNTPFNTHPSLDDENEGVTVQEGQTTEAGPIRRNKAGKPINSRGRFIPQRPTITDSNHDAGLGQDESGYANPFASVNARRRDQRSQSLGRVVFRGEKTTDNGQGNNTTREMIEDDRQNTSAVVVDKYFEGEDDQSSSIKKESASSHIPSDMDDEDQERGEQYEVACIWELARIPDELEVSREEWDQVRSYFESMEPHVADDLIAKTRQQTSMTYKVMGMTDGNLTMEPKNELIIMNLFNTVSTAMYQERVLEGREEERLRKAEEERKEESRRYKEELRRQYEEGKARRAERQARVDAIVDAEIASRTSRASSPAFSERPPPPRIQTDTNNLPIPPINTRIDHITGQPIPQLTDEEIAERCRSPRRGLTTAAGTGAPDPGGPGQGDSNGEPRPARRLPPLPPILPQRNPGNGPIGPSKIPRNAGPPGGGPPGGGPPGGGPPGGGPPGGGPPGGGPPNNPISRGIDPKGQSNNKSISTGNISRWNTPPGFVSRASETRDRYRDICHQQIIQLLDERLGTQLKLPDGMKPNKSDGRKPYIYSGEPSLGRFMDWLTSLVQWLYAHQFGGPGMDETRCAVLDGYLDKEAKKWYHRKVVLPNRTQRHWNFLMIILALFDRFIQPTTLREAIEVYERTAYNPRRGVQGLSDDLEEAATNMVEPPDDYSMKRKFMNSIPYKIYQQMIMERFTMETCEFNELVQKAVDVEEMLQELDQSRLAPATYERQTGGYRNGTTFRNRAQATNPQANHYRKDRGNPRGYVVRVGTSSKPRPNNNVNNNDRNSGRTPERGPVQFKKYEPKQGMESRCYSCNQPGHFKNDKVCPNYGRNRTEQLRAARSEAGIVAEEPDQGKGSEEEEKDDEEDEDVESVYAYFEDYDDQVPEYTGDSDYEEDEREQATEYMGAMYTYTEDATTYELYEFETNAYDIMEEGVGIKAMSVIAGEVEEKEPDKKESTQTKVGRLQLRTTKDPMERPPIPAQDKYCLITHQYL